MLTENLVLIRFSSELFSICLHKDFLSIADFSQVVKPARLRLIAYKVGLWEPTTKTPQAIS